MAISKDDILEAVGSMSVMDLNDLVKAFEEKFGVSAAAMAVAGPALAVAQLLPLKSRPNSPLSCPKWAPTRSA
jgi:ribosomal protein L7/L12